MAEKKVFTNEETGAVCASLEYLIHSGISVAAAVNIAAEDEPRESNRKRLTAMAEKADSGMLLSEVMEESGCFEEYVTGMVSAGERTGRTEEALGSVAASCMRRASLDGQLKSALMYPAVLLLVMLAVMAVLLIYVLPVFDSVYSQLGSGLTGVAGGLLSLGRFLKRILPALIALFALCAAFLAAFSLSEKVRNRVLAVIWKKGGDSGVAAKIDISRFARGLAMGTGSGLDIEDAIRMAAKLPDSGGDMNERAEKCLEGIASGESLAASLKDSGLMPGSDCRILEAGIRSGCGDRAMEQIAERLEQEADSALAESVMKIEPLIVGICAALTGLILLSVMLPLVDIMSVIG